MTTFANYLDTLGPEQFTTYTQRSGRDSSPGSDYNYTIYGAAPLPDFTFGQPAGRRGGPGAGMAAHQGYVDSEGNFLGLGSDYNSLYNNSPDLQRQYQESVANDPARQAQILENRRLEAEYARIEHEQRLQMMADRQSSLPTLANFAPTPQMGGGLLGQQPQQMQQMPQQQYMPQQQMPQQPQGINPYALHRGSQGGMGLMGGGLTRGGVAPSGGGQ
jgi:hypothetical protein